MLKHLNLTKEGISASKVVYVCLHHYDWATMEKLRSDGLKYPWNGLLSREKYQYLYTGTNEVDLKDDTLLYFAPTMSRSEIENNLSLMRQNKVLNESCDTNHASFLTPSAVRKVNRDKVNIDKINYESRRKKRYEGLAKSAELPRTLSNLVHLLDEKNVKIEELQQQVADLQLKYDEIIESNAQQEVFGYGLNRIHITSTKWHEENQNACKSLLGFKSYQEYKHYFHAFWPLIEIHTDDPTWDSTLSLYEQLTLVKLIFSTDINLNIIMYIYRISKQRVGQILSEYAPHWGIMGLNLSILTITEDYLIKVRTSHFVDNGHENCSFGCDGKDFPTEDINTNSAFRRNMYSDKVKSSAFRTIGWNLQNGLSFEHCPLLGSRSTEGNIVRWWGSHDGVQEVKCKTKIDNLLYMQSNKKRKREEKEVLHGIKKSTPTVKSEGKVDIKSVADSSSARESSVKLGKYDTFIIQEHNNLEKNLLHGNGPLNEAVRQNSESFLHNYGPDSDCDSKKSQIEVLLRLNTLYENGTLSYCALSHYVYYMKTELEEMLKIINGDSDVKSKVYFTKLKKIPLSTYGITDRGFKGTSMYYPNGNRILYPTFMSDAAFHKQFSKRQLTSDKKLKTCRWKEEAVFSRVTNEKYISGIISFHKFRFIEHCYNWGMARCNLNNDFVAPIIDVPYKIQRYDDAESDSGSVDEDDEFSVQL